MRLICAAGFDMFDLPDEVGLRLGLSSRQKAVMSGKDWAMYLSSAGKWVGLTSSAERAQFFDAFKYSNLFVPGTQGVTVGAAFITVAPAMPLLKGNELGWFKKINPALPAADNLIRICGSEREEIKRDSCGIFIQKWDDVWVDREELGVPAAALREMMRLPVIGNQSMYLVVPPTGK